MNILILEDRGSISYYLGETLKKNQQRHTFFSANSVLQAQDYWEDEKIDCIIADLNMSPDGLTPEEVKETQFGLLTGWVWLKNYVFAKNAEMKKNTIIYSDYVNVLHSYTSKASLEGIYLVPKSGNGLGNGALEVLEILEKISTLDKERKRSLDVCQEQV